MNFKEYQLAAKETAIYPSSAYPRLALAEEVGEFLGVIAKCLRDKNGRMTEDDYMKLKKEAGDVLWQLAMCLRDLGIDMQDAAEMNIAKLRDRKARGVLGGSGDDR
jgi:NTP pyrophosphatase (non-canonical NTP hydrolase)